MVLTTQEELPSNENNMQLYCETNCDINLDHYDKQLSCAVPKKYIHRCPFRNCPHRTSTQRSYPNLSYLGNSDYFVGFSQSEFAANISNDSHSYSEPSSFYELKPNIPLTTDVTTLPGYQYSTEFSSNFQNTSHESSRPLSDNHRCPFNLTRHKRRQMFSNGNIHAQCHLPSSSNRVPYPCEEYHKQENIDEESNKIPQNKVSLAYRRKAISYM